MNIALNSERITFQKNTTVIDENANHRTSWEDYFTCWAYVGTGSGSETESAGLTVEHKDLTFTVRYCSELSALDSVRHRVVFKGQTYNIQSVDMMSYKHKTIKVMCEWEGRETGVNE